MERRTFLTALVPATLVPAGLSASTMQLARLKTPETPDDPQSPVVPLPSERRFVLCEVVWTSKENPESLLDLAPGEGYCEWRHFTDELLTREHALLACAGWNGDAVAKAAEHGRGVAFSAWHVVVELLGRTRKPLTIVSLDAGGTGEVILNAKYRCRLVQPTNAERAAYPVDGATQGITAEPSDVESVLYEVLIVETSTLQEHSDERVKTHDLEEAVAFADSFNRAELSEPLGFWAVVRRSVS